MSNRLTAFARVPRGSKDGKPQKRDDLVRLDANFLERFERVSMSPDLSTIMTKTDAKLSIEINAQASVGYSLVNKQGGTVADKADIKRIQTMSASITKERKAALGEEVGVATKFTLAAFVQKSQESADLRPIIRFHKGFVGVYRTVNTQYQTITKNLNAIEALQVQGAAADVIKNTFGEMGRRISSAIGEYLFHRAHLQEDETPEKLNAYLFGKHVPIYIFNKLATAVISTTVQGFDVRHLIFPKDPAKGMFLTFKEIRNASFRNDLFGLMSGSQMVIRLASDDNQIRRMINLPATTPLDNFDEVNSVASKMANTPFYIIPFEGAIEANDLFNFLAKNGVRGVNWVSGTVLTPVDLLKYYGTIAKRMFYLLISRPQHKAALLGRMFPGFVFNAEAEQRDIFAQLKTWSIVPGSNVGFFASVRAAAYDADQRLLLSEVFNDVVMVNPNHEIATGFQELLRIDEVVNRRGDAIGNALLFTEVKNLAISLRERRIDPDVVIGDRIAFSLQKKVKVPNINRAGIQERSRLTVEARNAVHELRTRGYSALALRMQTWFRLFLDEIIQEAVAGVFLARLESFLDAPLELTLEDRQGFMDPFDPNDAYNEAVEPEEAAEPPAERENPDEA